MRSTVSPDGYVPARSLLKLTSQTAQIVGNAAGGGLVVALGPSGALLINASLVIGSFARELGAPTPLFSATLPIYAAAMSTGYAMQDTASTCAVLEAMAGIKRRKGKRKSRKAS